MVKSSFIINGLLLYASCPLWFFVCIVLLKNTEHNAHKGGARNTKPEGWFMLTKILLFQQVLVCFF